MPYVLGIDIADSWVSAAVCRYVGSSWSSPVIVTLDTYQQAVPSVLNVSPSGTFTVGDGSTTDGGRVAREFVQRIGDNVPMVVTGEAYSPQALTALLSLWVAEQVASVEEARAEHIVLSHPAGWGPYRKQLLIEALWQVGLGEVTLLPSPVTAGESHAWDSGPGHTLAVYSLGGNDFTASVVRRGPSGGFELMATQRSEGFGAGDFDEALAGHVTEALGKHYSASGLRQECVEARDSLSSAYEADILGVLVSRTDFEDLIRPALRLTVDSLVRTVDSSGLQPDELHGIALIGAGARTPLITQLIAAEFPCDVLVDTDPQVTAAAGAALAACRILSPPVNYGELDRYPAVVIDEAPDEAPKFPTEDPELPPRPPVTITKLKLPRSRRATSSSTRLAHARGFTLF